MSVYEHSTYGYNYRLSNICAAIGLGQMQVLDTRVTRRREIFKRYKTAFARPGIAFMPEPEGLRSTRWLTALTIDQDQTGISRENIRCMLLEHQIESRPLWKPMHMGGFQHRKLGRASDRTAVRALAQQSLPKSALVSPQDHLAQDRGVFDLFKVQGLVRVRVLVFILRDLVGLITNGRQKRIHVAIGNRPNPVVAAHVDSGNKAAVILVRSQ